MLKSLLGFIWKQINQDRTVYWIIGLTLTAFVLLNLFGPFNQSLLRILLIVVSIIFLTVLTMEPMRALTWFKNNPQVAIAGFALLVSVAALLYGIEAQAKQQVHNQKSLQPKLEFTINHNAKVPPLGVSLISNGVGPAIIDSLIFYHPKGGTIPMLIRGYKRLVRAVQPEKLEFVSTRPARGSWLLPRDSLGVYLLAERHKSDSDIVRYVEFIQEVQIFVYYHSVYGNQFRARFRIPPEVSEIVDEQEVMVDSI